MSMIWPMANKKMIRVTHIEGEPSFDGNLSEVHRYFQVIEDCALLAGLTNINYCTTYRGYDGGIELLVTGERLETDKEFNERVKKKQRTKDAMKKAKIEKDARDLKEYARLKKKFEKLLTTDK